MHKTEKQEFMRKPVDEMFAQRAYPHGDIPFEELTILNRAACSA
jgi:hypothetical protein